MGTIYLKIGPFFYLKGVKTMIKKTITYTDYNDVERTEDFYFHLNKAELVDMQYSINGGLAEYYQRILKTNDEPELIKIFRDLVLKSYGVKTDDGRGFMKFDENGKPLSLAFSQTAAFVEIYTELASNDEKAAEFFNGIIPESLRNK